MTDRLSVGDTAPAFTLPTADGPVSLSDYAGQRVIVYFYPAALTPGCTKQAVDFTAHLGEFAQAGYAIIGISPDPLAKLSRFTETEDLTITLASDETKDIMKAYGAYGTKMNYGKQTEGVIRSTIVVAVNEKGLGTVEVAQYNVKATGHVDKLMRDLKLVDLT